MKTMMARLDRLEADIRRTRSARSDPFADGVLERLTDAGLGELGDLFRCRGVDELEDMPVDAHARAMELLSAAKQRSQPAPSRRDEPGYDPMAEIREVYEASKARLVQSTNPATARAGGA